MSGLPVLFETVWASLSDGWAVASRAYARAMVKAGIDVRVTSWMPVEQPIDPTVLAEVGHLQPDAEWLAWYRAGRADRRAAYIFSTAFGGEEQMREPMRQLCNMNMPPRMLYTMFERLNVAESTAKQLNSIDGVWVPCSANKAALERAGCCNVVYIPFPYFVSDPHLQIPSPREFRVFYWIGRWEPRKAPDNLIRAFLRAFRPGESKLVLKLGPHMWSMVRGGAPNKGFMCPYEEPESVINHELLQDEVAANGWTALNAYSNIEIIRGSLSAHEMMQLHARCDVYVSASRGEGIDLPSHTAKLSGRRLVTTDSGGPRDVIGDGDILVPSSGSKPAPEYTWLWGPDATYTDYSLNELVAAMQRARSSTRAPERLPKRFRSDLVGALLKDWVEGCL